MTKSEFYRTFIRLQKQTGQGLGKLYATISTGPDAEAIRMYLDELVEEGLISCHDDGTTIGHPDSSKWYVPTSGYNVWTDWDHGSSFAGGNLDLVRYYLGAIDLDTEPEGRENNAKYLHPSAQVLTQHPGFMMRYAKWLEKNHEALEELKNLSEEYPGGEPELDEEGVEFITSREWFKDNLKVSECMDKCRERIDAEAEIIKSTKRLIGLMEESTGYEEEIKKHRANLEETQIQSEVRKKVMSFMMSLDQNLQIKEAIGL